jgi:cytochrome c biogenesis protein CcdA
MGAFVLAFAAGGLSLLSPCVLPLLPVVIAGAVARHRLGLAALAGGLAASATAFGFAFALLGGALDRDVVRLVAAGLLVASGLLFLNAAMERGFARATAPIAAGAASLLGRLDDRPRGAAGQALVGVLLGALWLPCGGPTLGAALGLAARRESLATAALVMAAYSAGAVVPLLLLAYGSRRALPARRLAVVSRVGKPAIGMVLVVMGLLALTGADKALEAHVVDRMPEWLVDLTTRF